MNKFWVFVGVVVLMSGCGKEESSGGSEDDELIKEYLTTNAITYKKASGVYIYDIVSNPEGSNSGNIYAIYYTLKDMATGTVIDSHQAVDGDPIKLLNNGGAILPIGLDRGLDNLRVGETRGIIIPGRLGYANYPTTAIPADYILHFEVEVVSRESADEIMVQEDQAIQDYITANDLNNTGTHPVDPVDELNNGVYYKRKSAGTGPTPTKGDSLSIDYSVTLLDGAMVDSRTDYRFKFNVNAVLDGLDNGCKQMQQGENALIFIPSAQAYGASVRVIPESAIADMIEQFVVPAYVEKVKPYEVLLFDVTLQSIY